MTVRFDSLVVDTTPLLKGTITTDHARHLYTTPSVISEIKDATTRDRLAATLLPHLTQREPSSEAVKICMEAAKKTGDLASLSRTDLGLVALVVTLDMERNPGKEYKVREPRVVVAGGCSGTATGDSTNSTSTTTNTTPTSNTSTKSQVEPEWITADNMEQSLEQTKTSNSGNNSQVVELACASGDCAVQNLLLSLRLKAYDSDLKRVRQTKSFLLRCHACGWTTDNTATTTKFCDSCGSPCLLRCTYTLTQDGQKRLWLKPALDLNLRGTIYPLAKPQGGRHADPLVLRADQREFVRAVQRAKQAEAKMQKRSESSMEEVDDRLAAIFGDMQVKGGRQSMQAGKAVIGHGRRNPNQVRHN